MALAQRPGAKSAAASTNTSLWLWCQCTISTFSMSYCKSSPPWDHSFHFQGLGKIVYTLEPGTFSEKNRDFHGWIAHVMNINVAQDSCLNLVKLPLLPSLIHEPPFLLLQFQLVYGLCCLQLVFTLVGESSIPGLPVTFSHVACFSLTHAHPLESINQITLKDIFGLSPKTCAASPEQPSLHTHSYTL